MPKLCPNITFPHQQDFFPIRSVTKSSTARFSHENLVEKFKIFVQDFVPIRTALTSTLLNSSIIRLYPQNPVLKIVHDESVIIVKHSSQKHTQHVWR